MTRHRTHDQSPYPQSLSRHIQSRSMSIVPISHYFSIPRRVGGPLGAPPPPGARAAAAALRGALSFPQPPTGAVASGWGRGCIGARGNAVAGGGSGASSAPARGKGRKSRRWDPRPSPPTADFSKKYCKRQAINCRGGVGGSSSGVWLILCRDSQPLGRSSRGEEATGFASQ